MDFDFFGKKGEKEEQQPPKKKLKKAFVRIDAIEKALEILFKERKEQHKKLNEIIERGEKVLAEIEGRIPWGKD